MTAPAIAACLIVKDAAATIEACLQSVRPHVGEVNVYETGSTDGTLELLERIADQPGPPVRVERGEWRDDFAWAREQSFAMASEDVDWLLWVDDDELLRDGWLLRELLERGQDVDYLWIRGAIRSPSSGGWKVNWRTRVVRADAGIPWRSPVHAVLEPPSELELRFGVVTPKIVAEHPRDDSGIRHGGHFAATLAAADAHPRLLKPLAQELINRGELDQAADVLERLLAETAGEWSEMRLEALMQLANVRVRTDVLAGLEVIARRDAEKASWAAAAASGRCSGFASLGPDFWHRVDAAFDELSDAVRRAGRNDPCPCDSGAKAKRCCGAHSASGPLVLTPAQVAATATGDRFYGVLQGHTANGADSPAAAHLVAPSSGLQPAETG